ncbi:uncharacterized protein CcaverHIS019_0510650 [Cutaneotrichosporon cavernicola]|uniref:DASH complex subunit SPC19 n=1 Tax=Cutaneotrichosporon cavernicola TaxID=279322 RepID=A0AA48QXK6_9TREE|nr:uncharacterized protein CcaverHIS019_0510650 [Cutaneotrichosporon cavernicola]BEI93437.1 hypothetical protein CcaverHIS019_0510650 [Cutaneotrichosporon cavernicola]BEJ01215.1 hypothetical protein CcaverHIS631_0510720 [Cutaneotrichosporon cavernicola]
MSRQSYYSAGPRASRLRESMVVDVVSPLDACVNAAEACVETLGSAVTKLEPGVQDMGRLKKVLRAQHHYLVLPATEVQLRRVEYATAIEKQLEPLLARSAQLLESEAAQIRRLEGRLAEIQGSSRAVEPKSVPRRECALDGIDMRDKTLSIAQRRKIGTLKNRRQKLLEEQKRLMGEMGST